MNKKIRSILAISFLFLITFLAFMGSVFSLPNISLSEKKFIIEGRYGFEKTMPQIIVIDTVITLPDIEKVNKGLSFLNKTKGKVTLSNGQNAEFFIYHNSPPYIYIEYKRANKVFLNFHDPNKTRTFYRSLRVTKDKGQLP